MLLSAIALLVVRLYCLLWLLQGIAMLVAEIDDNMSGSFILLRFLPSVVTFVFSVVTWLIAPWLARFISRPRDTVVAVPGLSREDLFAGIFVLLGLYFVLGSLGDCLNGFHYFLWANGGNLPLGSAQPASYYVLSRSVITLIAGLACIVYNRRFAGKLNQRDIA
jgi:hypothetical protein